MQPFARDHELAFRTQYAELKERTAQAGPLLPGTPGTLALRKGTGTAYWYRVFYPVPGKQGESFVCKDGDDASLAAMRDRIAFAGWAAEQVTALRRLGFQVADKSVARVLVELYNRGAFAAGLIVVGTLGYMAWLNELGLMRVAARTLDIDLARREPLQLAAPLSLVDAMDATGLAFAKVPGFPSTARPTSLKLRGTEGLRIDLLAPGRQLGAVVAVPEMAWAAQTVPHYDYLLEAPATAALLAGGHCVPVRVPQAARLLWHKLYASTQRQGFAEKGVKDRQQALVLAAALTRDEPESVVKACDDAPAAMRAKLRSARSAVAREAAMFPEMAALLDECLVRAKA